MKLNRSINTILALLTLVPPIFNPSDVIKNLKKNRNKIITVLGEFVNDNKTWLDVENKAENNVSNEDYLKVSNLIDALSKSDDDFLGVD